MTDSDEVGYGIIEVILRAPMAGHAVADGQNRGKAIVLDLASNLAPTLVSNYSEFPNSCHRVNLAILANAFQMLIYGRDGHLKQLRDQHLREP
jgi:hypothetical protein